MSLVYFKNVSKSYNGFLILDNITFTMEAGEFVSLVGRSGVGKTTLLKMLIREELPTKGKIYFNERDIAKLKGAELALLRRKIGVVFKILSY